MVTDPTIISHPMFAEVWISSITAALLLYTVIFKIDIRRNRAANLYIKGLFLYLVAIFYLFCIIFKFIACLDLK